MRILSLVLFAAVTAAGTTPLIAQDPLTREPVSLLQVLDSVAARYPSLDAARARIRAARGSRGAAGTLGNPMLMYQVENAPLPGRAAPPMDREMMLTATLPLEPLYQRWSRVGSANAEIRAAEADAQADRQRIELDATRAFYRMARTQVALAAARDLTAWLDSVVAYNRTRVKEGVAAEADLIRSELERDRAEADATMQEADLARVQADLSVFLGDQPRPLVVVVLDARLALPDVGLGSRAGSARPDIRAARERVAAAGAGVTTERTNLIRQLGITVGTKRTSGTTSLIAGVSMPFPLLDQNRGAIARAAVDLDRASIARYGLNVADVREAVETGVGGMQATEVIDGRKRFPIVVRLAASFRSTPEAVEQALIRTPAGGTVTLSQVARVRTVEGPEAINHEGGQRYVVVQSNVRGRDLGGFAADVKTAVRQRVTFPPGYYVTYGGQFENQSRATRRLGIIVPLVLLAIAGLLYATFDTLRHAVLVMLTVPFALVGGIVALWLRGLHLNLSASVGFIALFGVAVLNGVVLVTYINQLRAAGRELHEGVREGATIRLRPVLMTALVASVGFIPMAISTGAGAEVQRPLATVVIGGLVTSTLLTLLVLPTLYSWVEGMRKRGLVEESDRSAGAVAAN
ncbi:MAG: hypothetical protein DMD48_10905 [Gemmatimonadetes bacterium]|nr:MAG: hypothetical protein DMD48_10905 [Gemmatimonadota bacterium]